LRPVPSDNAILIHPERPPLRVVLAITCHWRLSNILDLPAVTGFSLARFNLAAIHTSFARPGSELGRASATLQNPTKPTTLCVEEDCRKELLLHSSQSLS
jgi:hypothetical protein